MLEMFGVNPWLVLIFLFTLVLFVYKYMVDTYSVLENLGIPGPKPTWIFGNVLEFKNKNVLDVFSAWKQKFGDVYGFYEGFRAGVVVNTPELAKDILTKHFDKFYIRTSYRPFIYYPDDLRLISIDGDHWKNQRSVLSKMLNSSGTLSQVVKKVQETSLSMIKAIESERQACMEGINISKFVERFTSETVMKIVLDLNEDETEKHGDAVYRYQLESNWSASAENEIGGLARLFPSLTPFLKHKDLKHKEAHEEVVDLLREYLDSHKASENNNSMREADHTSLLSFLNSSKVLTKDIDGSLQRRALNTDETVAHILSLLSEMYSTTAAIIQFLLYELAMNQECQEKVLQEINTLFREEEDISMNKLLEMDYMDKFFCETYRQHPVAPGLSRVCAEDCKIQGVQFKQGLVVRVMTSPLYRDETIFPNPDKFNPENFSKEKKAERHQYTFLPFGQGPRMCPGHKLAQFMYKVAIVTILRNFKITTSTETEVPLQTSFRPSLCPKNGVHISLVPRH